MKGPLLFVAAVTLALFIVDPIQTGNVVKNFLSAFIPGILDILRFTLETVLYSLFH